MDTKIFLDKEQMSEAAAMWIVSYLDALLQQKESATVVLSGGSTPKKLYELLASEKYSEQIEWNRLYFFWGDERYVPFDDERNNARMAIDTLLSKVGVSEEQIVRMDTRLPAEEAAADYAKKLAPFFTEEGISFDLVLMGMGSDGHTLSLFPGNPSIYEKKKVFATYVEQQKENRITLSAGIVNASKQIVFLIAGADKAAALKQVMHGAYNPDTYPTQLIKPLHNQAIWFLDQAAAAEIPMSE